MSWKLEFGRGLATWSWSVHCIEFFFFIILWERACETHRCGVISLGCSVMSLCNPKQQWFFASCCPFISLEEEANLWKRSYALPCSKAIMPPPFYFVSLPFHYLLKSSSEGKTKGKVGFTSLLFSCVFFPQI